MISIDGVIFIIFIFTGTFSITKGKKTIAEQKGRKSPEM